MTIRFSSSIFFSTSASLLIKNYANVIGWGVSVFISVEILFYSLNKQITDIQKEEQYKENYTIFLACL